ncbi:MAG: YheV family putative zinc ribbon protein [Pseudomonadales bacterium]
MPQQKRFIAGATCPACKQLDKTIMYSIDQQTVRECVSCGHLESLDELGKQQELQTRVTGEMAEEDVSAVQIIDPRTLH